VDTQDIFSNEAKEEQLNSAKEEKRDDQGWNTL
jgi:hypothetical protein